MKRTQKGLKFALEQKKLKKHHPNTSIINLEKLNTEKKAWTKIKCANRTFSEDIDVVLRCI